MTTIDHLITSRTLTKVIHHFCNFYQPLPIREIARRIGEDAGNVHKMIQRLEKAGLVEKQGEGYEATYHAVENYQMDCLRALSRPESFDTLG